LEHWGERENGNFSVKWLIAREKIYFELLSPAFGNLKVAIGEGARLSEGRIRVAT
jgi:hypothetical protein